MIIGHRLNGHGPNRVMFLHGWFGDSSSWSTVDHLLPDDQYTKAFLDYRGYGLSRDQKGQYTIEEIGEDTLALADHLGWDTFSAVGHSIGGKVVQKLAATAAARLHRIVAVTPVPAAAVPFDDATW